MWNEKEVHQLDTGYNMWPWPLTSLMTLTLDVSRSNFEIAVSQELLVWLMWNEKEVSWYDTGPTVWLAFWPHAWPWPWSSKVRVWNSFISGMGWPIDMERKGCESSWPWYRLVSSVTLMGWADVPDCQRGDFRRLCAVDISSLSWWYLILIRVASQKWVICSYRK